SLSPPDDPLRDEPLRDEPLRGEPLPAPSASTSRACELWVSACSSSSRRWKRWPRLSSSAMISRDFIAKRGNDPSARILVETRLAASEKLHALETRQGAPLPERWLVLWRSRGRACSELLQAIDFPFCRIQNHGVVFRNFHRMSRHLERLRIFPLLIQRQCQAENNHGIRVAGVRIDGLLQFLLCPHEILFLELNGAENRIRVGA